MAQELKRLKEHGYVESATEITEDFFVSSAVITVKKVGKKALDSLNLNEITVTTRKAQMPPNIEELISRISRKTSQGSDSKILASKLDFDYAYGQIKLDENTQTYAYLP